MMRGWLVGVTLSLCVALGLALLVPRVSHRELEREKLERLEGLDRAAQIGLERLAQVAMAKAAEVASDRTLVEAVAALGTREVLAQGDSPIGELLTREREKLGATYLVAVDAKGRVVGFSRPDAGRTNLGAPLEGHAAVATALRGRVSSDTWILKGDELLAVSVAPLFSARAEVPVGALVVARSDWDAMAKTIRETLGAQIGFYLRDRLVGSAEQPPILSDRTIVAPGAAASRRAVVEAVSGTSIYAAVSSPLAGEAAKQGAQVVTFLGRAEERGLGHFLKASNSQDLSGGLLWLVGGLLLGLLGAGLFLYRREIGAPLQTLKLGVGELVQSRIERIDERGLSGATREIADLINGWLTSRGAGRRPSKPAEVAAAAAPSLAPAPNVSYENAGHWSGKGSINYIDVGPSGPDGPGSPAGTRPAPARQPNSIKESRSQRTPPPETAPEEVQLWSEPNSPVDGEADLEPLFSTAFQSFRAAQRECGESPIAKEAFIRQLRDNAAVMRALRSRAARIEAYVEKGRASLRVVAEKTRSFRR